MALPKSFSKTNFCIQKRVSNNFKEVKFPQG